MSNYNTKTTCGGCFRALERMQLKSSCVASSGRQDPSKVLCKAEDLLVRIPQWLDQHSPCEDPEVGRVCLHSCLSNVDRAFRETCQGGSVPCQFPKFAPMLEEKMESTCHRGVTCGECFRRNVNMLRRAACGGEDKIPFNYKLCQKIVLEKRIPEFLDKYAQNCTASSCCSSHLDNAFDYLCRGGAFGCDVDEVIQLFEKEACICSGECWKKMSTDVIQIACKKVI